MRNRVLVAYMVVAGLAYLAGVVYLLINKPLYFGALALAAPFAIIAVTHPRLALMQFVFCLFIEYPVLPSVPVYLIDISALLVIAAAIVDLLTDDKLPSVLPPMTFNYLYLLAALVITGVVGYFPSLLPMRLATMTLMVATFVGLYRLMDRVSLHQAISWYFWLGVIHSVYVLIPFVAARGLYRSFGFSGVLFDDLALAALPVGVALYLGSRDGKSILYLIGSAVVAGGLAATQSRLSIVFAVIFTGLVVLFAVRRLQSGRRHGEHAETLQRRLKLLVVTGIAGVAAVVWVAGDLFTSLFERFEQLQNPMETYSTVRYRLVLWERAIRVFLDHPIAGLGPGGYYNMHRVYTTDHLTPMWYYFRTLGAHNVLLHYLAMTGLIGGIGLIALVGNTFRQAYRVWKRVTAQQFAVSLALLGWATMFLVTTFIEANWMWGQLSFMGVFMVALIAHQSSVLNETSPSLYNQERA